MDIKLGSKRGEKHAEAKNPRQLLVSNFSWKTIKWNLSETHDKLSTQFKGMEQKDIHPL